MPTQFRASKLTCPVCGNAAEPDAYSVFKKCAACADIEAERAERAERSRESEE